MRPIIFIAALVMLLTTTDLSFSEKNDGSKNEKREEFLIVVEDGSIRFLTANKKTDKKSQPAAEHAIKISCEKSLLRGHIDKNGKYQLQFEMTGNVQIAGEDLQAQANRVELNAATNRVRLLSTGKEKVRLWWKGKEGRNQFQAKQMEFDLSGNALKFSEIKIKVIEASDIKLNLIDFILPTGGP